MYEIKKTVVELVRFIVGISFVLSVPAGFYSLGVHFTNDTSIGWFAGIAGSLASVALLSSTQKKRREERSEKFEELYSKYRKEATADSHHAELDFISGVKEIINRDK